MPAATSRAGIQADSQFGRDRNQDDLVLRRQREQQKQLNKNRQEKLKKDTDKLLALTLELKQYVDKTNENVLSVEVIRKAEEIEKLARQVRERMKEDYTLPPAP